MNGEATRLRSLGARTALVVIDMQRLFAEHPEWRVRSLPTVLPNVARLVDHRPGAALYTRFLTPARADGTHGSWRRYYRRWRSVTRSRLDPALLELVPPLAERADAEAVFDKATFSSFGSAAFGCELTLRRIDTLILAGVETDVCVLATALAAVDLGYHVVIAADAVTSAAVSAHRAVLERLLPRFEMQIEAATTDEIIAAWPRGRVRQMRAGAGRG